MGSGEKSPLLDFFKCLWVIFYFGGVSSTGNTPVALSALCSGTADWRGEFRRTECSHASCVSAVLPVGVGSPRDIVFV